MPQLEITESTFEIVIQFGNYALIKVEDLSLAFSEWHCHSSPIVVHNYIYRKRIKRGASEVSLKFFLLNHLDKINYWCEFCLKIDLKKPLVYACITSAKPRLYRPNNQEGIPSRIRTPNLPENIKAISDGWSLFVPEVQMTERCCLPYPCNFNN
ncbi:hypothetical protein CEXT_473791 [Caerostris extrusa]|uniref:Uncharacterized protein n=1 Tax=Caerostris extrusa TaxID=172846 RepID=A0AAV4UMJ3_CAEEX|nr:hypothetical protein CEXT_473791 [Caerostris extrusa]